MRHKFKYRGLSRTPKQLRSLFRNMVDQLVVHERLQTTFAKALELRRHAERVVRIAKLPSLVAKQRLMKIFRTEYACNKAMEVLAQRYKYSITLQYLVDRSAAASSG